MHEFVGFVLIFLHGCFWFCLTEQEQPVHRGGAHPYSGQAKQDNDDYTTGRFSVLRIGHLGSGSFSHYFFAHSYNSIRTI